MIGPLFVLVIALFAACAIALVVARRAGGMSRQVVLILAVVAALWQFVVGAGSSLQLAAPGVGDRARWVPDILVALSLTVLPIGFALCLWGSTVGRRLAAACAIACIAVSAAAAATLSVEPVDLVGLVMAFALFAAPGVVLLACSQGMRDGAWGRSTP